MFAGFLNRSMINVARGARFSVSYNIAIQGSIDNMKLSRADLWLYPKTQENSTLLDLDIQIRAEALNLSRMVTRRPAHTWQSQDRCIPLDVTTVVKKLFRALHNRGHSSAQVKFTFSIINVLKRTDPVLLERLSDSRCQALTTGCNQKQFLVLKYSRPKPTHQRVFRPGVIEPVTSSPVTSSPTQAAPTSNQQGTNSTANTTAAPSRAPPTPRQLCKVEDYHVDFKLIGINLLFPKLLNIKQCSGACSETDKIRFTIYGRIKSHFSNLPLCCVPTKLSDVPVLIRSSDGIIFLLMLNNSVVEECGCS